MAEMITMAEHYRRVAELMRRLGKKTNVSTESRYHAGPMKIVSRENFLQLAERCEKLAEECDG